MLLNSKWLIEIFCMPKHILFIKERLGYDPFIRFLMLDSLLWFLDRLLSVSCAYT